MTVTFGKKTRHMGFLGRLEFCIIAWLFSALIVVSSQAVGQQLEDVVYLKNGSIIRGLIIEHVPGETIKIQTRDGNLFVYEIRQVDRIMKESRKKSIGGKSPGLALGLSLGGGILVDGVGQFYNGEIGKGFGFVAWSLMSQILLLAGTEDNERYGFDIDDDDFLTGAGLISRIACYTTAAVDAYKSAKRKNEEIGYGRLSRYGNRSYPRLNLGFGRRGSIFVRYWQSF